jgi:hypothetical protein
MVLTKKWSFKKMTYWKDFKKILEKIVKNTCIKGVSVAPIEMVEPTHQTLWNLIFK